MVAVLKLMEEDFIVPSFYITKPECWDQDTSPLY